MPLEMKDLPLYWYRINFDRAIGSLLLILHGLYLNYD